MITKVGSLLLACTLMVLNCAEARIFHDDQGRKIEADLILLEGNVVTILKGDSLFKLPISKFSDADQKFITEWARKKELIKNAPKPGETLTFEFPDLIKDFHGKPAAFTAKIPDNYDPLKPTGVLIYLDGANGHNGPGRALELTKNDFVCAGLPYPDDGRNPNQNNMVGSFDEVWAYWRPMLAKLEETVPNLNPKLRIIGGFSNGAHAIDGLMANREFVEAFSAFYLIDGGGALGSAYQESKDRHVYIAYGEKSPNKRNSERVVQRATQAGMNVVSHMMAETGHAFPGSEAEKVKAWIYEKVIPDLKMAE
ncbi:MAG: hypothetical protein AB8D78_09975 [Akkermansiaceae bacterium]